MDLAIILDPVGQHCKDGVGVREDVQPGVVAFQRFDEALGHAVALRAADRREQQREAERPRHVSGVFCD